MKDFDKFFGYGQEVIDNYGRFETFGNSHLLALLIVLLFWISLLILFSRIKTEKGKRISRYLIAGALFLTHMIWYGWWIGILGRTYDMIDHLPFELCSMNSFVGIFMLLTKPHSKISRWLFDITYFWTLGGALQTLITPDIVYDFPHFALLQSFAHHSVEVLAVLYAIFIMKYVITIKSFLRFAVITNAYLVLMYFFNMIFGTNYLHLNHAPPNPSIYDILINIFGQPPMHIIGLEILGALLGLLLYAPWGIRTLIKNKKVK